MLDVSLSSFNDWNTQTDDSLAQENWPNSEIVADEPRVDPQSEPASKEEEKRSHKVSATRRFLIHIVGEIESRQAHCELHARQHRCGLQSTVVDIRDGDTEDSEGHSAADSHGVQAA